MVLDVHVPMSTREGAIVDVLTCHVITCNTMPCNVVGYAMLGIVVYVKSNAVHVKSA